MFFRLWTGSVLGALKSRLVVLVVDETKLLDKLGVMVVGVVMDGRCIPLAWRMYRANHAAGYPAEGQSRLIVRLLKAVRPAIPTHCKVRVLADRGLGTSALLMRSIMAMGWTFLFRVTKMSKIVLSDGRAVCFHDQVTQPGQAYAASGLVFKKRGRVPAHVRVVWGATAKAPWALVTNDPTLVGWEYAQRMWIEQAFRDLKSYGWQVEQAADMPPQRMQRLWIFLVVAYAWMLLLGNAVVAHGGGTALRRHPLHALHRHWSLFREGRRAFLVTLLSP